MVTEIYGFEVMGKLVLTTLYFLLEGHFQSCFCHPCLAHPTQIVRLPPTDWPSLKISDFLLTLSQKVAVSLADIYIYGVN